MANMVNMTNFEQSERSICGLRGLRLVVMLNEQEDSEIQAYRFSRHIGSKAEAMRRLIKIGLEAEKMATAGASLATEPAEAGDRNTHKESCNAAST